MGNELFAINAELAALFETLADQETGEINPDIEQQINAMESATTQKLVGCRNYYQVLAGKIDAASAEAEKISGYIQHLKIVQTAITRILTENVLPGVKVHDDTGRTVIGWRASKETIFDDESKVFDFAIAHLPDAIETPAPRLKKSIIKDYLKNNPVGIDGVRIENKNNIQIK